MNRERQIHTDQLSPEQQQDLDWIEENRILFWLSATVAFEQIGRGALVVDLISDPVEQGHSFGYYAEGELELQDENLRKFLNNYDPDHEFIVVLLKPGARTSIFHERQPSYGWETDLITITRHERTADS